jgi:MoxR-like ATPase
MSEQLNPGLHFYHDTPEPDQEGAISIRLPSPQPIDPNFPYQDTGDYLIERCLAALDNTNGRLPMPIRFIGAAGVGKNATTYHLANKLNLPLYIIQGHEELTPEDIVVSGAIRDDDKIEYIASPLVAAMVEGGLCFFDEIGKVRPRGLAPLSSVLDERRRIYSALLGRWIVADKDFRFCCALNPDDPETFELPLYIISRTLEFSVTPPSYNALLKIIKKRNQDWEDLAMNATDKAKEFEITLSTRDLLYIVDYAHRIKSLYPDFDLQVNKSPVDIAIEHCIGKVVNNEE